MILSKKRIIKALISLRICAGWSAPLLFANPKDRFSRVPAQFSYFLNTQQAPYHLPLGPASLVYCPGSLFWSRRPLPPPTYNIWFFSGTRQLCVGLSGLWRNKKTNYSKTCLKRPLKNRRNKDLKDKWYLNEGRKYYRMLSWSILQYFWSALSDNRYWKPIFGLLFEWRLKTGFTVTPSKKFLYKLKFLAVIFVEKLNIMY